MNIQRDKNFGLEGFFTGSIFEKCLIENPSGPFLEIGCGGKPILPDLFSALGPVDCLDIDQSIIRDLESSEVEAEFFAGSICDFLAPSKYAFILDAHLLHCLNDLEDYRRALRNSFLSLKEGGLFFLETMISHSSMSFEEGLEFRSESFKLIKGDRISRLILPSLLIEDLFKLAGFHIEQFKTFENLRMIPHDHREEPLLEDPQVLRLIASRPYSL
jgi:SAM-dependent methyltransferase